MNTVSTYTKGFLAAAAVALMFVAATASAQGVGLRGQVIGNGGVSFATGAGDLQLGATIGQSIVGPPMNSGGVNGTTLLSGFWYSYEQIIPVEEIQAPVPTNLSLEQNYPNPFNPSTKIKFAVPEGNNSQDVTLNVYNAVGMLVKTLVNEPMKSGTYETTFDGVGFTSGVYVYELRVGSQSLTKKMIMSK